MLRRIVVCLLVGVLLCSVFGGVEGANQNPVAFGVDVSSHQGKIDWKLLEPQIDFAILRCGYGRDRTYQDDTQWFNNVNACTEMGIPFGAYIYSYALTEEAMHSEADHVLRLVKGYDLALPIYLDLEHSSIKENCTAEEILNLATIFCEEIEAAGYTPGIYSMATWWEEILTAPEYDQWAKWVAQFNSNLHFDRPYSMWQFSETGRLDGIQTNVDLNYLYGWDLEEECTNHEYTSRMIKEPTCTSQGTIRYSCTRCGYSYDESIYEDVHRYLPRVIQPTKYNEGYFVMECHCGSWYIDRVLEPTHHIYDEGFMAVMPTEEEWGFMVYRCTECPESLLYWNIPPTTYHSSICPSHHFEDIPSYDHWAHEGIDYAIIEGLFNGVSEACFAPDETMTRAMLVTVMWRRAGCLTGNYSCGFLDVDASAWYADAVNWASSIGIINGVEEGRFDPMGEITREQFATILYRLASNGAWGDVKEGILDQFPDGDQVSNYAREALAWVVSRGYITGTVIDGVLTLNPQGVVTRAQAATIIGRLPK